MGFLKKIFGQNKPESQPGDDEKIKQLIKALNTKVDLSGSNISVPVLIEAIQARARAAGELGRFKNPSVVKALLKALASQDDTLKAIDRAGLPGISSRTARAAVIQSLGRIGDLSTIDPLIACSGLDLVLTSVYAEALACFGQAAIPSLLEALHHKNRVTRITAIQALGLIGDRQAVDPLIHLLKDQEKEDFNVYVVSSLEKLGDSRAVQPLIVVLKDEKESNESRVRAAHALGKFKDESIIPVLIDSLKNENSEIKRACADALGMMGSDQAIAPLVEGLSTSYSRSSAVDALEALKWQPTNDMAGAYYWAAKKNWDKCIEIGSQAVIPLLDLGYPDALNTVGQIGPAAVQPLIDVLRQDMNDPDKHRRGCGAAKVLGEIGDPVAADLLLEGLSGKYADMRMDCAIALGKLKEKRALPVLLSWLNKELIVTYEKEQEIPRILGLTEPVFDLLRAAITALGLIGDERAAEPLIELFERAVKCPASHDTIKSLVISLGDLGDRRAVIPLINFLEENRNYDRYNVAVEAATSLGKLRDPRAEEVLVRASQSREVLLSRAAESALKNLELS